MVSPPAKVLFSVGTAAWTVTHAPVVLVPLVALLETEAVMLVSVPRLALPLVLLACGQTPTVGAAAVVVRPGRGVVGIGRPRERAGLAVGPMGGGPDAGPGLGGMELRDAEGVQARLRHDDLGANPNARDTRTEDP